MPNFRFTALDASGQDISGVISADSGNEISEILKQRGLFPTSVLETSEPVTGICEPDDEKNDDYDDYDENDDDDEEGEDEKIPCSFTDRDKITHKGFFELFEQGACLGLRFSDMNEITLFEIPFSQVKSFDIKGIFFKKVIVETNDGCTYTIKGNTTKVFQYMMMCKFVEDNQPDS
jgi:hypothetical protein